MAQGALGAAGIRRIWAGAGLQREAYRGGGILRGFPHSLLFRLNFLIIISCDLFICSLYYVFWYSAIFLILFSLFFKLFCKRIASS